MNKFPSVMRIVLFSISLVAVMASHIYGQGPAKPADLTTLSGKTYKQARVFRVEPDGINYMFAGGIVKIAFADLPDEIKKQYGYDPKKSDAFAKADEAAQVKLHAQIDADAAALKSKHDREVYLQNLSKMLAALKLDVRAKISSINEDGILAYIMIGDIFPASSGRDGLDIGNGMRWWNKTDELDSSVFIKCKPNPQAVDGDIMFLSVYPCGTRDTNSRRKCYTTDVVEAAKFLNSSPNAFDASIAGRTDWAPPGSTQ